MKFVAPLTAAERLTLLEARDQGPTTALRRRAQAVELSSRGYRRTAIADLLDVHCETVSGWLDLWDTQGLRGLYDLPRSGRPPVFTPQEAEQVRAEVKQSPRQLRQVQARLQERLGKTASRQTLRRVVKKKYGWRWKRCRRSLKQRRDEAAFRAEQDRLVRLRAAEARGQLEIFYFDAAGFNLIPCVPYAWQPPGVTYELPRGGRQRLNVLGLLNRANEAYFYPHTGRIGSAEVIAALDHFAQVRPHRLTLVILDNAPIHHSEAVAQGVERWLAKGVGVHFLPPYCPELNRIEILWRKIKYEWLPFSAYTSFAALKAALLDIFSNVGSKYQITFG